MYTCIWHVKHEHWNYKPVEVIKELVKRKIGFRHTMYQQLQCIMNLKAIIRYFFYMIISICIFLRWLLYEGTNLAFLTIFNNKIISILVVHY